MAEGQVPEGTVKEVLNWVGDDPERARQALEAETSEDGKDRDGVKEPLKQLIADADAADTPPEPLEGAQESAPGPIGATASPATQGAGTLSLSPEPVMKSQDEEEQIEEGFVKLEEPLSRLFLPPHSYTTSAHLVAGRGAVVPESLVEETQKHNKEVRAAADEARADARKPREAADDDADAEDGEDE